MHDFGGGANSGHLAVGAWDTPTWRFQSPGVITRGSYMTWTLPSYACIQAPHIRNNIWRRHTSWGLTAQPLPGVQGNRLIYIFTWSIWLSGTQVEIEWLENRYSIMELSSPDSRRDLAQFPALVPILNVTETGLFARSRVLSSNGVSIT